MKFTQWICGAIFTIAAIAFAVLNRAPVEIVLNPFAKSYEVPLFLVALAPLAAGFLLGCGIMLLETWHVRAEKRSQSKRIKTLETTLQAVNENVAAPPSEFFPVIPAKAALKS